MGKDILTTHSVYWSTMLMALGLPLPGKHLRARLVDQGRQKDVQVDRAT